jgi:hypothetical protein
MRYIAILIVWALLQPTPAYTEDKPADCATTLQLCQDLVDRQTDSIKMLKDEVDQLEDRIVDDEAKPKVPWWAYVAVGALVGAAAAKILR